MLTLVLGASEKSDRYSNMAIRSLKSHGHDVLAVGLRSGSVDGVQIQTGTPSFTAVDTLTLYLSPANQRPLYEYMLALSPRRVIFNPGTENPELEEMLTRKGILPVEACTLVLLSTGQY
ncbi:MAG: hypothetical protein RL213_840 [Bacteroidota bacterium]|jgi:predicted CoA-binding protein